MYGRSNSRKILKFVLLGEGGVGKTSIRYKYLGEGFRDDYIMTLGADIGVLKTSEYLLQIYDLAGQHAYRQIRSGYYFGAHGGILVFGLEKRKTMELLDNWLHELYSYVAQEIPIIVVGNKADLRDTPVITISREEAEQKVNHLQNKYPGILGYVESSAKEGLNIHEIFDRLISKFME